VSKAVGGVEEGWLLLREVARGALARELVEVLDV
jgi:hypothetical protein